MNNFQKWNMRHQASRALCALAAALVPAMAICDPNDRPGSCDDLKTYVKNTGVRDGFGAFHDGSVGVTVAEYTVTSATYSNIKPFKPSPGSGYKKCYSAIAHIKFHFDIRSSQINWTPSPAACDTAACKNELTTWQGFVQGHEAEHKKVYESYFLTLQKVFTNYPVQGCVTGFESQPGSEAAKRAFRNDIGAKAKPIIDKMNDDNKFIDGMSPPDDALPTCSACAPCPCPPGQMLSGGQCLKQCPIGGGEWSCGYPTLCCGGACCGNDKHGQPVGCCYINGKESCCPTGQ